ncbi:hypothetical protein [Pyruvatibacter mobilis]|uniref:hypothetical protein n=1 Tax=Pyruvatibacter mobilis TaxID=1712261 RepID=UPI003C7EC9BD
MQPTQTIFEFIECLPDTIKSNITVRLLKGLGAHEGATNPDFSYQQKFRQLFCSQTGTEAVWRATSAAALLDLFLLQRPIETAPSLQDIAREHDDPELMRLALAEPLRHAHLERAAADWIGLREGPLSLASLQQAEALALEEDGERLLKGMRPHP